MTSHLASRRGWALALSVLLAFVAAPVHAACNANPQARIGPNQQTLFPETSGGQPTLVTLDASTSTPNSGSNVPTVAWTVVSKTPSTLVVNLQNANTFVASFSAPDVPATGGSVRLRFTITCGDRSEFAETIINITDVLVNQPPSAVLTISPDPAIEGDLVTLDGTTSSDPDGTAITAWTFEQTGGPVVTLSPANVAGSKVSFIAPNLPTTTTFTFKLTVTSGGLQGSTTKMVNVDYNNDVPVAALACPGGLIERDEGQSVTFDGSASNDPDGSIFSYAWSQNAGLPNLGVEAFTTSSITFDVPSLGLHQLGVMTVTLTVTDNLGAMKSATCGLVIKDVTAPAIDVPDDIVAEAEDASGAVVSFDAEAQDAVDDEAPYPIACVPPSGSTFALAPLPGNALVTPVECSATDAAGNSDTKGFNVTVRDTTAPTMSIPGGIGLEATSGSGAVATFSATKSDLVDGPGNATCVPASGATFPLGATTVKCDAADARGNAAAQQSFVVNVLDTTPPVIDAHDPVGPIEATSSAGAPVSYDSPATLDIVDGAGVATCTPPPGSTFPLGHSTVTCNATDAQGNRAVATTFDVEVVDTTAPTIAPHADVTQEATSAAGSIVTYLSPATSDIVDGAGVATCLPASGTQFALGDTTVTCNAQDAAGNEADATTFVVHVVDTTPPTIAPHGPVTTEATGPTGALVSYTSPATSDLVDGAGVATCSPASNTQFALGNTTVTCNAQDAAGNHATATTFEVHVVDTTPPAIDPHGNVGPIEATGPTGATATYTAPLARDIVDGNKAATCVPASGTTFALGTTTVNCSATDAAGNDATPTSFTVTVRDTTAPVIAAHADVVAEATGPTGANVTYTSPATSDAVDGAGTASCLAASGTLFALGEHTVTCTASDAAGNVSTSTSFKVTVRDTTPPTIAPHADIDAISLANSSAVVTYTSPTASDIVDTDVPVNCTPLSGATFPAGTTTINCTATDDAGNSATSSFKVNVRYAFTGFFKPIDNLPIVNVVKAGQAIPVKFSLGGNQGLNIFAAGYPKAAVMTCSTGSLDAIEETVTAGGSSLSYDALTGQYIYVWKTEKSWGGTCRQLQVTFADGTTKIAHFNFTR